MRWLALALKYGPWRLELLNQWQLLESRGVSGGRVALLAFALEATFRTMCRDTRCQPWICNVGHQQTHVNGPVPLYYRLGMLASSSKNERGSVQVRNEKWKKLSPAKAHAELERWAALADEVGQRAAPRTCREWIDEHVRLHNIVVKHKLRGLRSRLLCSSVVGGVGVWGCRGMRFEVFGRIEILNVSEGF